MVATLTEHDVWKALADVADPEIPVLSVVDMKIVTSVIVNGATVEVEITPTFAGCPALDHIRDEIKRKLKSVGFVDVRVKKNLTRPWSTDMLDQSAHEKLRAFGLAPPVPVTIDLGQTMSATIPCPHCGSTATRMESPFGSTLCKQPYFCTSCQQSFERFKTV